MRHEWYKRFMPGTPRSPFSPQRGSQDVDVVVIGGGVNGVGVARDATLRGLKVALFERNDLAFGASGNSSGMIHGGVRYLSSDPEVTEASCRDSGHIQQIAPHLLFRIPFLMPLENTPRQKALFPLVDAFFTAYDDYQPLKRGKPHTRLTPEELRALEPGISGDLIGGISFDEWGIDGARLCVANAIDAKERGATIRVGTTVDRIERDTHSGQVAAVRYTDRRTGERGRLTTSVVVNATGAWSPLTTSMSGLPPERSRVRPGKGIHLVYDRRLSNYAIAGKTIDGRAIFIEPWQNMSVVGTTDDDYYGDLDNVRATSEEVRYLEQGIARVFPAVRSARLIGTWAGVRPTLYAFGPNEDALSRDHRVVDHANHGAPGMYSMIGGKLASYRLFSEEMVDVLSGVFKLGTRCQSHQLKLPGAEADVNESALRESLGIDAMAVRRLTYRHGARSLPIADAMQSDPRGKRIVCPCEPVTEAEIRHSVRHELAQDLHGVARRTRLGLGPCGGMRCAIRAGQIVGEELGWSPKQTIQETGSFLEKLAQTRAVGLGPAQAHQDALLMAHVQSQLGHTKEPPA